MEINKTKIDELKTKIDNFKSDDADNINKFVKEKLADYEITAPYCNLDDGLCVFVLKMGKYNIPFYWYYYKNIHYFGDTFHRYNDNDLKIINDIYDKLEWNK